MKAAEKEHKKQKYKKKVSYYFGDPVLTRMEAPALTKFFDPVKKKDREILETREKHPELKPRKTFGAEPAFREVDKVFKVGSKLVTAGIDDPKKWMAWRDMAVASLKKCATAEKKFKAWMGQPVGTDETHFAKEFKDIQKDMANVGTPMLRLAQKYITAGNADA